MYIRQCRDTIRLRLLYYGSRLASEERTNCIYMFIRRQHMHSSSKSCIILIVMSRIPEPIEEPIRLPQHPHNPLHLPLVRPRIKPLFRVIRAQRPRSALIAHPIHRVLHVLRHSEHGEQSVVPAVLRHRDVRVPRRAEPVRGLRASETDDPGVEEDSVDAPAVEPVAFALRRVRDGWVVHPGAGAVEDDGFLWLRRRKGWCRSLSGAVRT
ncbi:hypothetical protein PLICRDRAFT_375444 [Plicaturopsis crispa FD-325 SS-3]|uniref:Uncharacterized protein n=1 Tax=Plicaturopsis crispa FD-325 SS-3 TaxID=944288 RepID=A0A0C9SXB0_PLICR|nr:hypothetical protein PLICRDRAFT_375444 [Plicaturopsis crispa FD-325 SS-3]